MYKLLHKLFYKFRITTYRILRKIRYWEIYFEFKRHIKNKRFYRVVCDKGDRGIGKSHILYKLSKKYNCPIITPTTVSATHHNSNFPGFAGFIGYLEFQKTYLGKNIEMVLIDEEQLFIKEQIEWLKNHIPYVYTIFSIGGIYEE